MPTLQLNITMPEGMELTDIITALKKAGIKDISANDDFIPMDEAMSDIFPNMSQKEIIGKLLKTARKNKKLTQVELAKQINSQKQVVSAIESGRRTISKDMARKLAKALDVHYKTFL